MQSLKRFLGAALLLALLGEVGDLLWLSSVRATITTTSSSVTALGNGATQVFTFNYVAGQAAYIQVTYTDANGVSTLLPASQFTLSLNPATPGSVWGIGGTVTYPTIASGQLPIGLGTTLTIARSVPLIQAVSSNQGQLFPVAVEQALDLLDMQIQQVNALFSRALVQPITDTQSLTPMPSATQRANNALCFDSTGYNPVACATPATGIISSAMQPVVDAASLAAGRTAFGLGSAAVENIGSYGMQDDGAGNLRQSLIQTADATNQTVTGAFHLTQRICSGPVTYALNRANTLWNGFGFRITAIAGQCTVTPNANDNFQGVASGTPISIPQGSSCFISTNGASSGVWQANCANPQPSLSASVAASALTITLNGTVLAFRDPTLTQGDLVWAIPAAGLGITVPSGATLGTSSSNKPFRLWVFVAYNGGTPVLGVATCSNPSATAPQIYACAAWETAPKSGTAMTAGATSLGTLYTSSAVNNDAVRIIGYVEYGSGLATAGTWATAPTALQSCMPPMVCKRPGDVVQIVGATSTTAATTTSSTPAALTNGITASIQPSSTVNLVRAFSTGTMSGSNNATYTVRLSRSSTGIGNPFSTTIPTGSGGLGFAVPLFTIDAPGSVSSVTYGILGSASAGTLSYPPASTGVNFELQEIMGALTPDNDNGLPALPAVG